MKILALEFSSPIRAVAVLTSERVTGYAEERGQSRDSKPFALITAALKEAKLDREEIDCIAVGLGPGSYGGIRSAISIAEGWQLARGTKTIGLSSAEVVAAHAGQFGVPNPVFVGLEAAPKQLYVAWFDASVFEQPRLIEPFRLVTESEAKQPVPFRMDWPNESEGGNGIAFPPEANFLAMLAITRTDFVPASQLEPIYLRKAEFVKAPPPRTTG
jgi:tRNA threonylcarbamoyl adenosine modification protein YeaZ